MCCLLVNLIHHIQVDPICLTPFKFIKNVLFNLWTIQNNSYLHHVDLSFNQILAIQTQNPNIRKEFVKLLIN